LFRGNTEVAVDKRAPPKRRGNHRAEANESSQRSRIALQLTRLYQAALEEPIPDDIMRLVERIGEQQSR